MPPPKPADNAQALRKQRAAIEAIAADNQKLKEELMLENKFSVNPTTATAAALIANLQQQADAHAKKITEEQRLKAELDAQVEGVRGRIAEQRVAMGGINNSTEQSTKAQRRIKILEDRVQKASVRLSEAATRNRALRDRVDSLRRERMLFEDLRKKMQRGAAARQQEAAETITAIAALHEAREKATILQAQVKAQAERDVAAAEAEWRKLTDIIDTDRAAREAQRQRDIAEREAQMAALFRQEFIPKDLRKSSKASGAAAAAGDTSTGGGATARAESPPPPAERVKTCKEELERVKSATGTASVDELLDGLAAQEEANFKLFAYVNDLNAEVEKLEESINGVRAEIERTRAEGAARAEGDRVRAARETAASLAALESNAESYEEKHGQALRAVNDLRAAVMDMFSRAGCATPAVIELLGEEGVTEANLMQYLGIVEQRTNELLNKYFALASDDSEAAAERAVAVLTAGHRHRGAAPGEFSIEPPTTAHGGGSAGDADGARASGGGGAAAAGVKASEDGAGDEELNVPLDLATLQARAAKAVAARAETAVKIKAVRPGNGGGQAAAAGSAVAALAKK